MKNYLLCCLLAFMAQIGFSLPIDSLENVLRHNELVQEKIYIHTDNQSYFVGDTIWYKAYLLRADNLQPSPLSKILYVELLTPDGYLVERQRIIVQHDTQSFGQFALPDSMYSGYYELRAYTRWQLNFNVTERRYSKYDSEWFFNKSLAKDYFRDYEGLYSRVFPIYEKPEQTGDYTDRQMIARPKRRLQKEKKGIEVTFYPEGGSLVAGLDCRVAFEALDAYGKPLDIEGKLSDGTTFRTLADGRGYFHCRPADSKRLEARFVYMGQTYTFVLPEVLSAGAVITYDAEQGKVTLASQGVRLGAVSVTCRGRLQQFSRDVSGWTVADQQLPTGVNEVIVYDQQGTPLAVRQIFVNHHDLNRRLDVGMQVKDSLVHEGPVSAEPFQQVGLKTQIGSSTLRTISISVHDQRGDMDSYDDGDIMTELLLSGDLKGFVAHPAYYFESDDQEHRERLNLLMMIQGWRKYAPLASFRYLPETSFAMEGEVFKMNVNDYDEFDLLDYTHNGANDDAVNPCFTITSTGQTQLLSAQVFELPQAQGLIEDSPAGDGEASESSSETPTEENTIVEKERFGKHTKRFRHPVVLEAELAKGTDVAGVSTMVDSLGRFSFQMPPYYDNAMFFMTAYDEKDSLKLSLTSVKDKDKMNPFACPEYYVRRDVFFPKFSKPYHWYQTHTPHMTGEWIDGDSLSAQDFEADHLLDNVVVKAKRRRPLRKFDKDKPAFVFDFDNLLNETTDYGLHFGGYHGIQFWEEAARYLFGNMNDPHRRMGIRATVSGHHFLISYNASTSTSVGFPMTPAALNKEIDPRRIKSVRVFTDYDMRNGVGKEENRGAPDVWFVLNGYNGGQRPMRRDRYFVMPGFSYPEYFYHRDYSDEVPTDTTDYRRTIYWNPNAHPDAEGNVDVKFYNGSRPAYLKISVCGVGQDGVIYYR